LRKLNIPQPGALMSNYQDSSLYTEFYKQHAEHIVSNWKIIEL